MKLLFIGLCLISLLLTLEIWVNKQDTIAMELKISELNQQILDEKQINEDLYQENKILANEIILRQDITSVIVDAARSYNLDPMLLARIIKSESNFRPNTKHSLPHIIGPAGINTKVWTHTKNNPNSYVGNIYTGAEILSFYLDDSDSLTMALTRYKGLSPLGLSQAKAIVKELK